MTEQFDELKVDPDYLKGFNEAYLLNEVMPDVMAALDKALPEHSQRSIGFKDGFRQHELDKGIDRQFTPGWSKSDPGTYDDIAPEKDIDKEDLEPGKE